MKKGQNKNLLEEAECLDIPIRFLLVSKAVAADTLRLVTYFNKRRRV